MNNKNKATMKETSKNCVSDYPLSNTEIAERGVKRGILRNRNERCNGCIPMKKLRVTLKKRTGNRGVPDDA
jgi:hypothetical protein